MNRHSLLVTAVALSVGLGSTGSTLAQQTAPIQVKPGTGPAIAQTCPPGWKIKSKDSSQWICVPNVPAITCPAGWNKIVVNKNVTEGSGLGQVTYHVCEVGCSKPVPPPK